MIEQMKVVMVSTGATWILWLLIALSVVSVGVVLERARVFWSQRDDVRKLADDLNTLLRRRDINAARTRLAESPSAEASIVLAGLSHWDTGATAVAEAMAAASGLQRARMEKRLMFLGTVGNNAPFIGLLGTVIGVLAAFDALGQVSATAAGSQLGPERVMGTIAEALVATAVGLLVAIPAVALFNHFQTLLSSAITNAETLGHIVLSHMGASPQKGV